MFANGRVIQKSADKIIMKRPNGTLVQRSSADVFRGESAGVIINQKTVDGLQAQLNARGYREDFEGGGYIQLTIADESSSLADLLRDPMKYGRLEEHTATSHLVRNCNCNCCGLCLSVCVCVLCFVFVGAS